MAEPTHPARVTAVSASTASTQALPARARTALMICNVSDTDSVAFSFGSMSAAVNAGGSITLQPGATWTALELGYIPSDPINIISETAGTPVTIIE